MREVVQAKDGAPPAGHYSHGIVTSGKLLFVSGQGPLAPATGELIDDDIRRATAQTLENLRAIVEAAGASLADVVKVNVYLRDIGDFAAMNEVYRTFFPADPPARTTIGCAIKIPVEIDCVVAIPE